MKNKFKKKIYLINKYSHKMNQQNQIKKKKIKVNPIIH